MKFLNYFFFILLTFCYSQTSEQIMQAKSYAKKNNMTEKDVLNTAVKNGFSPSEVNRIINKGKNIPGKDKVSDENTVQDIPIDKSNNSDYFEGIKKDNKNKNFNNKPAIEFIDDIIIDSVQNSNSYTDLKFFGSKIFKRDPSIFQASSVGAIDPNYSIGPGDEIIVMLWGETQFRSVLTVDREGFIFINDVGQVFVNGLNLNLLESKLFRVLSQSYASLKDTKSKATTFLDVSIGKLRPLRIQVLGQVIQPGAYTISPSATLFSSLYYFNGPSDLGSFRDIQLIRDNEKVTSIDFYDYLLTGKKPFDQKLQLDDVIFIPKRGKTVTILGEINRPGFYELKDDESLTDLLKISGGLRVTAYTKLIQIDRIIPYEKRDSLKMDRVLVDYELDKVFNLKTKIELEDGDIVKLSSIMEDRQNIVDIRGAVNRPGTYDIGDSLRIKDLINKAGGIFKDAYQKRIEVIRKREDLTEELIKINLAKVLIGEIENNIRIKPLDKIFIYSKTKLISKKYAYISGFVKKPGEYHIKEGMTLYDLLFKAGGYTDPKFKNSTYLDRADLIRFENDPSNKEVIPFNLKLVMEKKDLSSLLLIEGDRIVVYGSEDITGPGTFIELKGHVKKPGKYELFEKNMTIKDVIFKGGGFQDSLHKRNTFLDRADLIRYNNDRISRVIIPFNLNKVINQKDSKHNHRLEPNDIIKVYSKSVFSNRKNVNITGAVKEPGEYELKKNMTIKDLILEANGVSKNVYRYKVEVSRINPDLNIDGYAKIITFDLDEDYTIQYDFSDQKKGELSLDRKDFLLKPYDMVSIRANTNFSYQKKVSISGAVNYPGIYTLTNPDENIFDLIERSGGLKKNAYAFASTFKRNSQTININIEKITNGQKKYDLKLQEGDEVFVPTRSGIIQVLGQVKSPGFYKFDKRERVSDAIRNAGGLKKNADMKEIVVQHANGKSVEYKKFFRNPKIYDGSIIIVGLEDIKEPFKVTEYFKDLTAIVSGVVQILSFYYITINR